MRQTIDYRQTCAVCGRERALCSIPGLHGMVRERAALATAQRDPAILDRVPASSAEPEWVRRAHANGLPVKVYTGR